MLEHPTEALAAGNAALEPTDGFTGVDQSAIELPWCITPIEAEASLGPASRSSDHLAIGRPEGGHGVQYPAPDPRLDSLGR